MTTRPIVFMDTETTGLSPDDHIWEWAAIRREPDGRMIAYHCFVRHDTTKAEHLPEPFRTDHDRRYDAERALDLGDFVDLLCSALAGPEPVRIVGAVPNFDTERLARILAQYGELPMWHYHLRDVETLAVGYLLGRASLGDVDAAMALDAADDSDALSRACGVEPPPDGERHTAMGDVRWAVALYDAVAGDGDRPDGDIWVETGGIGESRRVETAQPSGGVL
jgi:hypothetical protein